MDKIFKQVLRIPDAVNLTRWIEFSIRRTFTMALLLGHRNAVKEDIVETCTVLRYYYKEDGIEEG